MYQPGDVLEINGEQVRISFDEWKVYSGGRGSKGKKPWLRSIEPYTWVVRNGKLEPIKIWTEVSEIELYSPKGFFVDEEMDPLK